MSGESGSWAIDLNEDDSGIVFDFDVVTENGVETFTTAMPLVNALAFSNAIVTKIIETYERHE